MTTEERVVDMILRRTDISEDDARYYAELAEMRVREYLKLDVSVDLVSYLSSIVTFAVSVRHIFKECGHKPRLQIPEHE